jgi:hypothetical protein
VLERAWARRSQPLEQVGEFAAVIRDVAPRVVVKVERGGAELARERMAVVVAPPPPLSVVHAEAMDENDDPARATRRKACGVVGVERAPCVTQRHRDRQRVHGVREVVAPDAVQHGAERGVFRSRSASLTLRAHPPRDHARDAERDLGCTTRYARSGANQRVDGPGEPRVAPIHRRTDETCAARDLVVHPIDDVRDAEHAADDQAREATQFRDRRRLGAGH